MLLFGVIILSLVVVAGGLYAYSGGSVGLGDEADASASATLVSGEDLPEPQYAGQVDVENNCVAVSAGAIGSLDLEWVCFGVDDGS